MFRHPSLHRLTKEHHQGLILAQILKKGSTQYPGYPTDLPGKAEYTVNFYNIELIPHFRNEEEVLFPAIKQETNKINDLIEEIINEHKEMNQLIEKIKDTLLNHSEDLVLLENLINSFGTLLESHIRKEERQLFELIQEHIPDEKLLELKNLIDVFN